MAHFVLLCRKKSAISFSYPFLRKIVFFFLLKSNVITVVSLRNASCCQFIFAVEGFRLFTV